MTVVTKQLIRACVQEDLADAGNSIVNTGQDIINTGSGIISAGQDVFEAIQQFVELIQNLGVSSDNEVSENEIVQKTREKLKSGASVTEAIEYVLPALTPVITNDVSKQFIDEDGVVRLASDTAVALIDNQGVKGELYFAQSKRDDSEFIDFLLTSI